jgi:hypothetical protein
MLPKRQCSRRRLLHGIAGAAAGLLCTTAAAQDLRFNIGFLTCDMAESAGPPTAQETLAAPQGRDMLCSFRAFAGGPEETYVGTIQSIGDVAEKRALIWIVKASSGTELSPGLLQQTYAADTVAPGQTSVPLVGDTNRSLVLQSMAETHVEAAKENEARVPAAVIAVVALKLRSTPG